MPRRIAGYKREYLDQLCYSGDVMWGRISAHPALAAEHGERTRRMRPTKLAPIALFTRADADELIVAQRVRAGESVARRARGARRDRAARRAVLRRHRARHETAAGRSRGSALAARRRGSGDRRRLRRAALADRSRSGGSAKRGCARGRAPSSGRWTLPRIARPKRIDADSVRAHAARALGRRLPRRRRARDARPAWREILVALRRMEARGEIRGGRFVAATSANSSRCPTPSTRCAPPGAKTTPSPSLRYRHSIRCRSSTPSCRSAMRARSRSPQ